jgi:hypothetical protein
MSAASSSSAPRVRNFPNGGGAAAVLAAGIGAFAVALFALLGDKITWFKNLMIFYKPTGPLSGVTTCAIVVWLAAWCILHWLWSPRMLQMTRIRTVALALLIASVLLTFPPIEDLF